MRWTGCCLVCYGFMWKASISASVVHSLLYNQSLKWYALMGGEGAVWSKAQRAKAQGLKCREWGIGYLGIDRDSKLCLHRLGGLRSTVSSPSGKVGFDVFCGFRNRQFLSTAHYSPVIVTGYDSFWPGWAQIAAGEAQAGAGVADPPPATPHFDRCA